MSAVEIVKTMRDDGLWDVKCIPCGVGFTTAYRAASTWERLHTIQHRHPSNAHRFTIQPATQGDPR